VADAAERWEPTNAGGPTQTSQVQDTAREKAEGLRDTVRESSTQLGSTARNWMEREADERTTAIASQAKTIADAMHQTSSRLDQDGQSQAARITDVVADRVERFAGYLNEADGQRLMNDVEDLARRNPWALAAAGLAVGFAASRFMKASRSDVPPTSSPTTYGSSYRTTDTPTYGAAGAHGTTGNLPAAPGSTDSTGTGSETGAPGVYGETRAAGS
jgi:hypothetical protein